MTAVKGQVWGGGTAPIDWARCGTEANYKRHWRLGEPACAPCKAAHARARRDLRARAHGRA